MPDLDLKRGEAKTITLTVTDPDNDDAPIDVSAATLTFNLRPHIGSSISCFQKDNAAFDKSQGTLGIVRFDVSSTDTNRVGTFYGELKIQFSTSNIDKSKTFEIKFSEAITA